MIQSKTKTLLLASLLPSFKLEATRTYFTSTTSDLLLLNHQMGIFKILDHLIFKSLNKCLFQATRKIQKQLVQHSWCPSQILRLPNCFNSQKFSSSIKAPLESTYYYTTSPICNKFCLQNSFFLLILFVAHIKFAIFTMNLALSLHVQLGHLSCLLLHDQFLHLCWPCLPRQGYCVYIHYKVQQFKGFLVPR